MEKTSQYVKKAGTVIMAAAILIWAITAFPIYKLPQSQIDSLTTSFKAKDANTNQKTLTSYIETAKAGAALETASPGASES